MLTKEKSNINWTFRVQLEVPTYICPCYCVLIASKALRDGDGVYDIINRLIVSFLLHFYLGKKFLRNIMDALYTAILFSPLFLNSPNKSCPFLFSYLSVMPFLPCKLLFFDALVLVPLPSGLALMKSFCHQAIQWSELLFPQKSFYLIRIINAWVVEPMRSDFTILFWKPDSR